ncbi:MAG: folate family ECF transporter S component [Oscillospiraceae bacterium]|nr:folate family ECF transporter S component [Oscillospiraceae bacterium]
MSEQKNKITLRQLTVSALLIALDVVFTRVLAINTPLMKIGLGFTAVAVSAMLYGPLWAALTAGLGDLIGALMFPTGAYFPGFTLTAALTGLIFGLFLYRREGKWLRAFLAALTNSFFVTLALNTLLIAVFFRSSPQELRGADFARFLELTNMKTLLAARVPQFFIMTAVQTAVICVLQASPALLRLFREKSSEKSEKNP